MSGSYQIIAKTKKVSELKTRITNPYCNKSQGVELPLTLSPLQGHPNTLQLAPSRFCITAGHENPTLCYQVDNFTLITRLQTDTLLILVLIYYSPLQLRMRKLGLHHS